MNRKVLGRSDVLRACLPRSKGVFKQLCTDFVSGQAYGTWCVCGDDLCNSAPFKSTTLLSILSMIVFLYWYWLRSESWFVIYCSLFIKKCGHTHNFEWKLFIYCHLVEGQMRTIRCYSCTTMDADRLLSDVQDQNWRRWLENVRFVPNTEECNDNFAVSHFANFRKSSMNYYSQKSHCDQVWEVRNVRMEYVWRCGSEKRVVSISYYVCYFRYTCFVFNPLKILIGHVYSRKQSSMEKLHSKCSGTDPFRLY